MQNLLKLIRIMKLGFILIMASLLHVTASVYSQTATIVLDERQATIADVFDAIEKQTEYKIFYKNDQLDINHLSGIRSGKVTVKDALSDIFRNSGCGYTMFDRVIVVVPRNETLRQGIAVSGTIIDETGIPMPGVNVTIKGSLTGVASDMNGKYTITVPDRNTVLSFSFIGYATRELVVGEQTLINVTLIEDTREIEEVVVVGYGSARKSDITGAIVKLKSSEFKNFPISTLHNALQGQVAGVSVVANSGAPGDGKTVRIRGVGTMNDNNPLYVIDGVPTENGIYMIDANDIESIEVLKDASAAAIYGIRAANGVILVTTKRGNFTGEDRFSSKISANITQGVSTTIKNMKMLNAKGYIDQYVRAYKGNEGAMNPLYNDPDALLQEAQMLTGSSEGTNWWNEITRPAYQSNYSIQVTGSSKNIASSISAAYFNQDGVVKGSEYERFNLRSGLDIKPVQQLKVTLNLNLSKEKIKNLETSSDGFVMPILLAMQLDPLSPVTYTPYLTDPVKYANMLKGYDPSNPYSLYAPTRYSTLKNPMGVIQRSQETGNAPLRALGNAAVTFTPIQGLDFTTNFSLDIANVEYSSFVPKYNVNSTINTSDRNTLSTITQSSTLYTTWLWENTIQYMREIDKHRFTILGGFTMQENASQYAGGMKANILGFREENKWIDAASDTYAAFGSKTRTAMMSVLGRLNYNYADKYLFTGTIRADGSSQFAKEKRWSVFPSFSVGWRIDKENFFQPVTEALDLSILKFRAGWGLLGNDRLRGAHRNVYTSTMSTSNATSAVWGNSINPGYIIDSKLANPEIQWEMTEQINFGLEAGLWDRLISLEIDYYIRNTRDMIVDYVPVPSFVGGVSSTVMNMATVKNTGIEGSINYSPRVKQAPMTFKLILSHSRNKVTDYGDLPAFNGSWHASIGNLTRVDKGLPIGCFWGYKTNGIIQSADELNKPEMAHMKALGAQPGDLIFMDIARKDADGKIVYEPDGKLDESDKTQIGTAIPDLTLGFKYDVSYKRFDFSMFWQGSFGNDILNLSKLYTHQGSGQYNSIDDLLDIAWSETNRNTGQFGISYRNNDNTTSGNNVKKLSEWYIEDGGYFRLKHLQIGYTVPVKQKASIRVFVAAHNLVTFTKYSGLDPEIGTNDPVNFGIDRAAYPQAKTYIMGLNLNF